MILSIFLLTVARDAWPVVAAGCVFVIGWGLVYAWRNK